MAGTDYSSYLRIDELLDLQHPLTEGAHDEMLFVVIHQAYELWFKLMLHELDHAVAELQAGRPQGAMAPLQRTVRVDELLIAQLRVLETLTPDGFLEFRDPLEPASGLQSGQFRAIEVLGGLDGATPAGASPLSHHDQEELRRRARLPTLYTALCASLRAQGLDAPVGDEPRAARASHRGAGDVVPRPYDPRSERFSTACASCSSTTTRRSRAGAFIIR